MNEVISVLPKKMLPKTLHPRGTWRGEFVFQKCIAFWLLIENKRVVKHTLSKVPFTSFSFSILSSRPPCTSSAVLYPFAETPNSFKSSTRSAILGFLLTCAILQFVYRCGRTDKLWGLLTSTIFDFRAGVQLKSREYTSTPLFGGKSTNINFYSA